MCSIAGICGKEDGYEKIAGALEKTHSRGPDGMRIVNTGNGWLGFNRLSIMGLDETGMQPFIYSGRKSIGISGLPGGGEGTILPAESDTVVVCNGEIYGFRKLKDELEAKGYSFGSGSDCELLGYMYREYGTDMFVRLDAEYAMILCDVKSGEYIAARDPIGIRPLYYGKTKKGNYVFASEPKNLTELADKIMPFPPGHYFKNGEFVCYRDMSKVDHYSDDDIDTVTERIHDLLIAGVKKRLDSDAPVGFLLSGGLDSSLVCGIAASLSDKPLETWAIGMDIDAIDLKYAREVAAYIHSNHHEVIISKKDVQDAVEEVTELLGTYDITTIRASIGMYLVCKAIHMYDVLRADRCISVNSLEARVPFGDLDFVEYCMRIDPELKLNRYGKGKYLLRKAFEKDGLIPESILWREKAAFSDAVGHSLKDDLTELADARYTDEEYMEAVKKYEHARPFTKESLFYRELFEKYYPGMSEMVADFWMPNKSWEGCDVNDPSARVLSNYGESGK